MFTTINCGKGNGNPLQYSCLENSVDRGAWWAAVHVGHRVRHDWSDLACMHALEKEMAAHSSILAWRIPGTEAAVYGVAQSQTRLKRLSSGSTINWVTLCSIHGIMMNFSVNYIVKSSQLLWEIGNICKNRTREKHVKFPSDDQITS